MSKKSRSTSKRQARAATTQPVKGAKLETASLPRAAGPRVAGPSAAVRPYEREFNPDYSPVIKDLKRIGTLAGTFFVLLIVLSFFLK
jgi:hypothetical protein